MTKEELKKEAEEYAEGMAKYYASTHEGFIPSQFEKYLRNACVSSAEPREKRIAELEARCNELFLQTCEQAEKIKELEAQIEKMKSDVIKSFGNEYNVLVAKLLKEWEIK